MRCSRYVNVGRINARLNGEPLKQVGCFKYLGSQVAADGGCERDVVTMNKRCIAWREIKSELSNKGLRINVKKCLE